MSHLLPVSLAIEAMHKPVGVQDINKPNSWPRLRVWDTHVDDYSNGWRYSIKHFACSSACERPASVESFICCWVGLKGSYGQLEVILVGGFERRYDPNSMKKGFMNNN